jgi:hypothetical protein
MIINRYVFDKRSVQADAKALAMRCMGHIKKIGDDWPKEKSNG